MPTINAKGQVTVPRDICARLGVGPGSAVDFLVIDNHVEMRPARASAYDLGKHLFGGWTSGHTDTSTKRKQLIRAPARAKCARRLLI